VLHLRGEHHRLFCGGQQVAPPTLNTSRITSSHLSHVALHICVLPRDAATLAHASSAKKILSSSDDGHRNLRNDDNDGRLHSEATLRITLW